MKYRIIFLFLFICASIGCYNFLIHPACSSAPVAAAPQKTQKILLVPLDGRPPCRKFVLDAGELAGAEILTPPGEIQDYYTQPGDTKALAPWLEENIEGCDAMILSIDQLLYGGLLAAREVNKTPAEMTALLDFLRRLHAEHPEVPIYAFNILPRMTPPASIDGYEDNKNLLKYSRLVDRYEQSGSDSDRQELEAVEAKISPGSLQQYQELFRQNTELNEQLSLLAQEGTLQRLIIGQDDGEKYSIPNIEKRRLRTFLSKHEITDSQVSITHGADEIALTLLTEIEARKQQHPPMVYVEYNTPETPASIMPYMAVSVEETVREKLHMLQGERTASPDGADYILFISCGTEENLSSREKSAARIAQFLAEGKNVALVDLSKHFDAHETLLPILIKQEIPLNQLIAYAGWNTTSNSIGTAMSEAGLFTLGYRKAGNQADLLALYQSNLVFLNNRYLEDYYYLKDVITLVNTSIKKAGYANVYDLDLEHNYLWATDMLREAMNTRIVTYKNTAAFRKPFSIHTPDGPLKLRVRELSADISYPWPRTFEIYLHSTVYLDKLP